MNACELIEKLGFYIICDYKDFLRYKNDGLDMVIEFVKRWKTIKFYHDSRNEIPFRLLNVINKQVNELKWKGK